MEQEPHILLYFDVNKTVIMHDPVQGKSLHHIVNDLLTEKVFGFVSENGDDWIWNGKRVLATADSGASLSSTEYQRPNQAVVSYGTFLRTRYPMSSDPAESKRNKYTRKLLRQDFTSPGHPGSAFATDHDALLECLRLRQNDDQSTDDAGSDDPTTAIAAAGLTDDVHHFIIPAFFRFIQYLHDRGTAFNLIFRTYGDDLHRIAQEFNLFCEGRHPFVASTKRMDGSDGGVDRRLCLHALETSSSPRFGTFYRSEEVTALVMGTFQQPPHDATAHRPVSSSDHEANLILQSFYGKAAPTAEVVHGLKDIHHLLSTRHRRTQATLAIRDFYPYWFRQSQQASAGKLMTVDPLESDVHAIFFDDNILPQDAHIVDARQYPTGDALPWAETRELHLMRVEPLEAIRDEQYFIQRFHTSLRNRGIRTASQASLDE